MYIEKTSLKRNRLAPVLLLFLSTPTPAVGADAAIHVGSLR